MVMSEMGTAVGVGVGKSVGAMVKVGGAFSAGVGVASIVTSPLSVASSAKAATLAKGEKMK